MNLLKFKSLQQCQAGGSKWTSAVLIKGTEKGDKNNEVKALKSDSVVRFWGVGRDRKSVIKKKVVTKKLRFYLKNTIFLDVILFELFACSIY